MFTLPKYRRQTASSYEPDALDSTSSKTTEVILIISSLVGSGSQLLKPMFHNSNQWTYIEQLSIKKDSIYEILGTLELEHATDTQKELILVNGHFGSVNYKLLPTFAETTILINFIRDPRSWINAVMWQNELSEEDRTELVTKLIDYHIGDLKSNYTEWLRKYSRFLLPIVIMVCFRVDRHNKQKPNSNQNVVTCLEDERG